MGQPWKTYLVVALIIGLLIGVGVGWVAKPPVEVPGPTVTETVTTTVTAPPTPITPTPPITPTLTPYEEAAIKWADKIWAIGTAHKTKKDLEDQLLWYARASEPYRGRTIRAIVEAQPLLTWEGQNLVPMFKEITGITVIWEDVEDAVVMRKAREEAEVKAGVYDLVSIDQDMNGFWCWNPGTTTDLTDFMERNPQITDPWLNLSDYSSIKLNSDPRTKHLWNLNDYQKPTCSIYRKDWFTDPKYKEEFKAKYGYELKTPLEWFLTAQKTGNIKDDWTIEKSLDVAEFFYRPDQGMYGCIVGLKAGYGLSYQFNDGMTHVFGLASPAKSPDVLFVDPPACRPYSITYGVYIEGLMDIKGASVERGGRMNSERGAAMFDYVINQLAKYAPPRSKVISHVEAHIEFTKGDCAFQHHHFCAFIPTLNAPESKVKGLYEFSPLPVSEKYWEKGMPRGYWDCEGWAITAGSKQKEVSWIFAQFTSSLAVDVWKNLYGMMPIRWSTINHPAIQAMSEETGGLPKMWAQTFYGGTDEMWPIFPAYFEAVYPVVAEGIEKGWSGQEIANKAAAALDAMLKEKGYIE